MKLPTPKKQPSGAWLIQCMVDGKRTAKTFATKQEAVHWAAGLKAGAIEAKRAPHHMTVGAATDRYIEMKEAVLSPSTIHGYKKIRTNLFASISDIRLADLTQEKVQRWVNELAKSRAPKTTANAHGLLSAVLAEYAPAVSLRTTLPSKVKQEVQIPSEAEIKAILAACKGTKYELPIVLAIWLGLRLSEILGLTWDCIKGDTIHIKQAIVEGDEGYVVKGTKTYSGNRKLRLPPYIKSLIEAQPKNSDRIISITGHAIYCGFRRICEKEGLPHFRFHDLRHTNASVMLAAGVPDKYSMKRMGHATNNMLKTVYQHTIKEKELEYDAQINHYFEQLIEPD